MCQGTTRVSGTLSTELLPSRLIFCAEGFPASLHGSFKPTTVLRQAGNCHDAYGMSQPNNQRPQGSTLARQPRQAVPSPAEAEDRARGFGGAGAGGSGGGGSRRRSGSSRRRGGLSKADWGPLGKHPDLEAIVARQRLHLPLSGRLTAAQVSQAWKRCAAEHHPDRGGEHDTMQLVNGARDLLLGRDHS